MYRFEAVLSAAAHLGDERPVHERLKETINRARPNDTAVHLLAFPSFVSGWVGHPLHPVDFKRTYERQFRTPN